MADISNENQFSPSVIPPIPPEPIQSEVPLQPVPIQKRKLRVYLPLFLAACAIVTGIVLYSYLQTMTGKPSVTVVPTIIVTPTSGPTPIRTPTALSGTSTFTDFVSKTATLSSKLSSYTDQDPSLSPPSLVLPLGF